MIITDLLTHAKKVDNYEEDATSGTLWTSTTTFKVICPSTKRWFLIGGAAFRKQSSTMSAQIRNGADKVILYLGEHAAGATICGYPATTGGLTGVPTTMPVLDAGDYVLLTFGTAQDSDSWATCVVLEIDI